MIATSMICPPPSRASRLYRQMSTALAVAWAAIPSASPKGGSVGGPSGTPVMWANPLIDSANVPNPGLEA